MSCAARYLTEVFNRRRVSDLLKKRLVVTLTFAALQCGLAARPSDRTPLYNGVGNSFKERHASCLHTSRRVGFWRHPPYIFMGNFTRISASNTDLAGCAEMCAQAVGCSHFAFRHEDFYCSLQSGPLSERNMCNPLTDPGGDFVIGSERCDDRDRG